MFGFYRSAARQLRRSPGFVLTVVVIVGIGIGLMATMYSIVHAVILQPLSFSQPDRLVALVAKPMTSFSLPTIQDLERDSHAFRSIAAYTGWAPRIDSAAGVGRANAILVSQNFFATLGVTFTLGHDFPRAQQETDCFQQAVVSYAYWQRMGGGNSIAGRTLQLDHTNYAIIGVLSARSALEGTDALWGPDIFTPTGCDPKKSLNDRGSGSFHALGRLKDHISLADANAELAARSHNLVHDYPSMYPASFEAGVLPLAEYMVGVRPFSALFVTLAACGLLLLISCANLVNLLLARNTRRRSEFAVRTSLGATPRHLLRLMLVENLSLVLAGAILAVGLAILLVRAVTQVTVVHLPRLAEATVDFSVLLFSAAIAALIALVLTAVPALRSLRLGLLTDMSAGNTGGSSSAPDLKRAGRMLVAVQLAMALVLVACAGWTVSSVLLLLYQPLGFDPSHLVIASTDLRGPVPSANADPERTLAVLNGVLQDLRGVPGVEEAAASNDKPLGERINRYQFCADSHPAECAQPSMKAPDVFLVTPEYFHTIGQQLYRGRFFAPSDDGRNHVAVVNRSLAKQQWPGENPIGHRIYSGELQAWATVVGEVEDVHSYSLERAPEPNLYLPEADGLDTSITVLIRTKSRPEQMRETIRKLLHANGQITLRYVDSMPERMSHQVALRRFSMWVVVAFGAFSLGLAIFGTYGLLAYEVSLREREIGIRLALGATREAIVALFVRQESRWIFAGASVGMIGALISAALLEAEFYKARLASLPVLGVSLLLLLLPALLAVVVNGRRASLNDPAITLRRE